MSDGVFIIAEAGVNHNGDVGRAIALVDAAAKVGADCIKFQAFDPGKLVAEGTGTAAYQSRNTSTTDQRDLIRDLALSIQEFAIIAEHCRRHDIEFLATVFDIDLLDALLGLGMKRLKVASGELTNTPALALFARRHLPIYLSTGMATDAEVDEAVGVLRGSGATDITVMQCTSIYPAPPALANLNAMVAMGRRNELPYGYSDHTLGGHISIAATALGATVIEKHFTLDRMLPGPDHKASLEPAELARLVTHVRETAAALGSSQKQPGPEEQATAALVRRSWHSRREISAGTELTTNDLILKRPAHGFPPSAAPIGRTASQTIPADCAITEASLMPTP